MCYLVDVIVQMDDVPLPCDRPEAHLSWAVSTGIRRGARFRCSTREAGSAFNQRRLDDDSVVNAPKHAAVVLQLSTTSCARFLVDHQASN